MSKAKILSGRSDRNFAFDDPCCILERAGFELRSGKGSHRIYYKDGVAEIVNFAITASNNSAKSDSR
jgi:hypothetical protein